MRKGWGALKCAKVRNYDTGWKVENEKRVGCIKVRKSAQVSPRVKGGHEKGGGD